MMKQENKMSKTKLVPFDIERAKQGAEVVTRCSYSAKIVRYNAKGKYPIRAIVKTENGYFTYSFTVGGRFVADDEESDYDLFIEEGEQEKTRREYSGTDSIFVPKDDEGIIEELIDAINGLWDNDALPMPLSIKRKDAWLNWLHKQQGEKTADSFVISPDKWYVCTLGWESCGWDNDWKFVKGSTYPGSEILQCYPMDEKKIQNHFRPWTIQDAKNGDVLACDDCIVLFKEIDGLNIKCHCAYHYMNTPMFFVDTLQNKSAFYPATEEECDALSKKIKEEGYELNPIKKKLEKVEKEVKKRVMTYQEVAWWLRRNPEEFREWKFRDCDGVNTDLGYNESKAHQPAKYILIRKNGGEWQEPLIEI